MTLEHARIVLTGGSGGLGRMVVSELQRQGAELTVLSRTWSGNGAASPRHVAVDLSSQTGIAAASAFVAQQEPDILINMAGVQHFGPAEDQSSDQLYRSYMVNLVAPVSLCRACLPFMKRRNTGQITNVGSIFGGIALAHFAAYSSAKAGLRSFSEALRRELADTSVAVTYVAPRAVRIGMFTPRLQKYAEATRMKVDEPAAVAARIVTAVKQRKREVHFGFPERMFVKINALLPRLIDAAVAGGDRKARKLFDEKDFPAC